MNQTSTPYNYNPSTGAYLQRGDDQRGAEAIGIAIIPEM
jgi:hypothetical protein